MDHRQIIGLRIAYYFVKHHDYRLLTISQLQGELFLINPSQDNYPIIRIDVTGEPLSATKIATLKQFMINQEPLTRGHRFLLTLALGGTPELYEEHEVVVISSTDISRQSIYDEFKGLKKVSWEVNNPVEDLRNIVTKLNNAAKSQIQTRSLVGSLKNSRAVLVFTIISLVFFALTLLLDQITDNRINSLIILGGFYKPFITAAYEVWRFITAGFLHSDFFHLFANVLALNNIGIILERIYGWKKLTLTILLSIIMGHFFVYIGETAVLTIGLSGGVYGLFGLLLVYSFESGFIKQPVFRRQIIFIVFINLFINFLPNVSWLGHLGGFVAGTLLGLVYSKLPKWRVMRESAQKALVLLLVMLLVLSFVRPAKTEIYAGTDREVIEIIDENFKLHRYTDNLRRQLLKYYESRGLLR